MICFTAYFIFISLQLAALHFNENSSRDQAVTHDGKERYDINFPKYKKGGYIVRKVTVEATYSKQALQLHSFLGVTVTISYWNVLDYLDMLIQETVSQLLREADTIRQDTTDVPEPLCSQYKRPEKMSAVRQHQSRFNL